MKFRIASINPHATFALMALALAPPIVMSSISHPPPPLDPSFASGIEVSFQVAATIRPSLGQTIRIGPDGLRGAREQLVHPRSRQGGVGPVAASQRFQVARGDADGPALLGAGKGVVGGWLRAG